MHRARRPDWIDHVRLVVITAREKELGRSHEDIAAAALDAGCRAIQLRDKEISDRAFIDVARRLQVMCYEAGALFFVNDRVDVAHALDCEVHLGFNDLPVSLARKALGPGAIIGYSPETAGEARQVAEDGADYLGIGSVFPTLSKADAGEPIGVDGIERMCGTGIAPVIAVGGITAQNAASVARAGASGIAVITAVSRAPDMRVAVTGLLDAFEQGMKGIDRE